MAQKLQSIVRMPLADDRVLWSLEDLETPSDADASPSPSPIESPLGEAVQLPAPFFPPSLVQHDHPHKDFIVPRGLPSTLNLPVVPTEKACEGIDSLDACVKFPACSRLTRNHDKF